MALVYMNGGDILLGNELKERTLPEWKKLGANLKRQRYMYKGYRHWGGKRETVVVYDTDPWSSTELRRRKANGFLGIREYRIGA